ADHAVNGRDAGMNLDQCSHLDWPGAVRGERRVALLDQRDRLRGRNRDDPADPGAGEFTNIAAVHDVLFRYFQDALLRHRGGCWEGLAERGHAATDGSLNPMRCRGRRSSAVVPTLISLVS